MGRGSSVGIATELRAGRSGDRIPVGGEFSSGPGAHSASCKMGTVSFPGVKCGRGVLLTTHPLLMPWSRKSSVIFLLPLWAVRPVQSLSACTRVHFTFTFILGRNSSVGIATGCGLDGPGIESRWGRNFPPVQTGPGAHPASCTMGTGSSPGVKCGRGVLLTTQPLLVPRSWKTRAIPLPTLWAT